MKGHLDRACKRQSDGGKHESVAMGPTLASPDEEYWAALNQWKTAGKLVDTGCTDQIVTNIDAFLDFAHSISGQKSQRRGFLSGGQILFEDQHTLKQKGIPMRIQKCFVCAGLFFKPLISLKMHGVGT